MTRWMKVLILMGWAMGVHAASLNSIEIADQAGKTSVVFSVIGPFSYKAFALENPARIVVDLDQTDSGLNLQKINKGHGLISNIRIGFPYPGAHTLRVVFDVKQPVQLSQIQSARQLKLAFIAGKVKLKPQQPIAVAPKLPLPPAELKQVVRSEPIVPEVELPKSHREIVVVLDPGHGGKDPGAAGPHRSQEKNVTLAIAQKLKQVIDRQPGMRAVLTRKGDYYVGLRDRLIIARKYDADIFISIHADAFINHNSSGASVFALSPNGATSEAARWLAEKENYSELGGVDLAGLDDENGLVRSVLIDLSQTATITASLDMGTRVLQAMDRITNLHNTKVEQARFVVLKSPDIPSILIETGFITNPREESNLTSPTYQTQLTQAIFSGLKTYFLNHPLMGPHLQTHAHVKLHVVKKGESLPQIAAKYHGSTAALKKYNHLKHEQVHTGQRLRIPTLWG